MNFGLSENTILNLNTVFENHVEIEKVIIYGSRAKRNHKNGSDIDFSLVGDNITFDILTIINLEIEALNTPYLYDTSIFHTLKSSEILDQINRVGKIFYPQPLVFN